MAVEFNDNGLAEWRQDNEGAFRREVRKILGRDVSEEILARLLDAADEFATEERYRKEAYGPATG